jgi:carboxyl-terminal processing protease
MDLLDDRAEPASSQEPSMRRFRKILILLGACAAALGLSIRHHGEDLRVEAHAPLRAAPRSGGSYDLSQLPIFGRTVHFVQTNYFDKGRMDPRRMLVGALDFLQRDVPEILVDRTPEADPKQVTVKVNGHQQVFPIENVDSPWALHGAMKRIFAFIQPRLEPVPAKEEARRLVEIEMAATNGMLNTLDPHSVLLDVESYKEMRTQTQGKFGGLGIIIEMDRKGRISVKRPMHDTPAFRAGIKAKDHIVRINNESTVNMTLQEAVERLRGDPGTTVDVYIERTGQAGQKKFSITRDFIKPPAIDPEQIRTLQSSAQPGQPPAKVGYFRIGSFSFNAERDLNEVLARFEQEKVKGLIMDLRTNPGGLYDQAQKVADAFIDAGTLVSMVGVGGSQRKDETATRGGNGKLPIVVLVNQNSASASEIVAGAVKNLDRGVVIGETTFGKGSVQMLFDIPSPVPFGSKSDDDRLGLKLTTAQYLTPGDLSIQGVGVTPDIDLVAMRVQKFQDEMWIRLQKSSRRRQEADLEFHLDHPSARRGQKPGEVLSYLFVPPPGAEKRLAEDDDEAHPDNEEDEAEAEAAEDNQIDFAMEFARDFLAQWKGPPRRREMLQASKAFFEKVRADEDKKLSAALEKLGVDWSAGGANPPAGQVQVSVTTLGGGPRAAAGSSLKLRGAVKNIGSSTLHRVRAVLKSDNPLFDENEMVFGKLTPGESKTYDLVVKVPKNMPTRTDIIKPLVFATGAVKANDAELAVQIDGKARPLFAYNYQTVDTGTGNGDGLVQRGERVKLLVTVKNMGAGASIKTDAILRNGPGQEGILISAGRFDTRDLAAGATKAFSFTYDVTSEFKGDEYQLELVVGDTLLNESVTDKIKIKVAPAGPAPEPASGTATVARGEAVLREAAGPAALAVARAPKGASYKVTGKQGGFLRVELGAGHVAFVAAADVTVGGGGAGATAATALPIWQVAPPVLAVNAPSAVTGPTVHIKGVATDDHQVKDVFIRVFNRDSKLPAKKVFYQPNRGDKTKLGFETDVPLWPGSNIIQVFARETNEVQSTAMLVVLQRQAPSLVQKVGVQPAAAQEKLDPLKRRPAEILAPPGKPGTTSVGR